MVFHLKGQGATEYLVLLAVVLIIALVSIALLGFFPGLASDAKITQSNTYWRGEARPTSIVEHSFSADGNGSVILLNNDASGTIIIQNMTFTTTGGNTTGTLQGTPITLASGDQVTGTISGAQSGTASGTYEFNVVVTYKTPNNLDATQYGMKPIVGKYH